MLALLALLVTQVHAIPCAAHVEGQQLVLADPVAFEPRTATLTEDSTGPVQGIACLLGEQPELVVQIEVHTDARGSGAYNLRISQERADALRQALEERGIAAERLTAVGRGESMPVEHEDWATSQAMSRRIELWTDPASRPEPPVIEPPPEPEPVPVVPVAPALTLCASLDKATTTTAALVGASSCGATATGWRCVYTEPASTLSGRVQACTGGTRDGDELFAPWRGGTLSVRDDPERPGTSLVGFSP